MKVVYKRTIDEKIADAVMTAQSTLRAIEKIVLTMDEYAQLKREMRRKDLSWCLPPDKEMYMGCIIEVELSHGGSK